MTMPARIVRCPIASNSGAASPDAFVMSAISSERVCASMNARSGFTPSV